MSDQLARFFAAAAERADAVTLAGAAAARRTGTRRRRARLATLAALCALVVAAIPVGVNELTAPHRRFVPLAPATSAPTTAPPSTTPSARASADATPTGEPLPPDPCSFQPAQCYPPVRQWHEERLPAPCTQPSHPSDALIVQRRSESRSSYYDLAKQGTTMYSVTLTRYRDGGAAKYLAEVRTELARCRTVARTGDSDNVKVTLTYRSVSTGLGGDESLLVSRSYRYVSEAQSGPSNPTYPIAVVRIGDVVAVVYDYGWEGSPSLRSRFDQFVADAIAEVRAGAP
jgi:hypothetical protein